MSSYLALFMAIWNNKIKIAQIGLKVFQIVHKPCKEWPENLTKVAKFRRIWSQWATATRLPRVQCDHIRRFIRLWATF